MSNPLPEPVSALRLVVHYALALAVCVAVYVLLVQVSAHFFDIAFPGAAMGLILMLVAASSAGGGWVSREKVRPAGGRVWKIAVLCAVLTVAMQGAVAVASAETMAVLRENLRGDTAILVIVVAAIWLVDLLVIRLGFGMGIRQGARQIERAAAKG